jgi:flagellar basal-body rod modification protein FlgD
MPVDPASFRSTPDPASQRTNTKQILDKDDFLKLFTAQLQHQDPMRPQNDSEFMGQMAQFSSLEQISNLAAANKEMAASLALSQSVALIGRTVTYVDADKASHTGKVERVATSADGKPTLRVDGTDGVDPSSISSVA